MSTGCHSTQELWDTLLSQQVHTTSFIHNHTHYTGGFSTTTGQLDHKFFGLSDDDASIIDPQHAMLLHTAWECLYNGGYSNPLVQVKGHEWGVFIGTSHINSKSILTSNASIARVFDLVGPVLTVDSSLCALDAACMSLNAGNCTAALVCGVDALLTTQDLETKVSNIDSSYMLSEGSSAVLLMPLNKANRESKRIYAVVKSTATNNNGAESIATPLTKTLTQLFNKAIAKSNIDPSAMCYIEGNSATPSELQAIDSVYGLRVDASGEKAMYLGSLQANIGHLEAGAGLAGLVKTILVLEHSLVPGIPCITETSHTALYTSYGIQRPFENITDPFPATVKVCAIVNSFQYQSSNATAILQQYTALPHMAGVKSGLFLLMDTIISADLNEISKTISMLENTFPQFLQAGKVCKKIHVLTKELAMFKLFQVIITIFTALGVHFSIIGSVDILGEILALAITGAIKESQAMKLVNTHKSGKSCPTIASIQDSISKPSADIFSHVLQKICYSSEYETELKSKKYTLKLVSMLTGERSNSDKIKASKKILIKMSGQTIEDQPILILAMNATTEQLTEIKQTLTDTHVILELDNSTSTQYIRQKCMELRDRSDELKLKRCTSKPSRGTKHALPHFIENHPLRAAVSSKINTKSTNILNESNCGLTESMMKPPSQSPTKTKATSPSTVGIKLEVTSNKKENNKSWSHIKILCQDCHRKEEVTN